MARTKILIPVEHLKRLYLTKRWSPAQIGKQYHCDAVTVRTRLREAGVEMKSKSAAQTRYPKSNFTGDDTERAYLLGFRYGDLNVYRPTSNSEIVVVRSHTTLAAQETLFNSLFSKYGTITTSRNSRTVQQACYLNHSFLFLLDKYPPNEQKWILRSKKRMTSFAAGYIDAEGTFGLNQGKGRFKIDAYDSEILVNLHEFFSKQGIKSKLRVIARKGENDYGWVWKRDLYRLSVNEAGSIEVLISLLRPFMQHQKRIVDASMVLANITQRRKNGTIR